MSAIKYNYRRDVQTDDPYQVSPYFLSPYTNRNVHFIICPSHQVIHLLSVVNNYVNTVLFFSSRTWCRHCFKVVHGKGEEHERYVSVIVLSDGRLLKICTEEKLSV